jgi:hypothetical protein
MKAARGEVSQKSEPRNGRALPKRLRTLLGLLLAAAFGVSAMSALAQESGGGGGMPMPKINLMGGEKRKLSPEEQEQQQKIDDEYKAATKKIPNQKAADPWADVRQAPPATGQKVSTPNASAQKKKQSAQQAQ